VFYHAERSRSAIDKFLVHLLGEREGRAEMGEGRGWKRVGREREGAENGNARKNSPKTQQICYHPVSYIFRKLFSGTIFPSQINMPLYLEPFKGNRA